MIIKERWRTEVFCLGLLSCVKVGRNDFDSTIAWEIPSDLQLVLLWMIKAGFCVNLSGLQHFYLISVDNYACFSLNKRLYM